MNWMKRTAVAGAAVLVATLSTTAVAHAAPGDRPGGGALRPLVQAGTITKEQARTVHDAVKAACEAAKAARESAKAEGLATLVSEGTITQAQADAVAAAPKGLRTLVQSGTITRAQADAIKAEFDEYAKGDPRGTALAALVSNGTITQAQADAVAAALPQRGSAS